jgi:hypothetical protein
MHADSVRIGLDSQMNEVDPQLGIRAVMSGRIDRALGTNVLAEERFAKHTVGGELKQGTVSAKAKGVQTSTPGLNVTSGETQRGMANLQFMDFLTGQVDRHGNNIMVDQTSGKVTGIDNDLAFGSRNHLKKDQKNFNALVSGHKNRMGGGGEATNNFGLPDQVDSKTAKSFLKMKRGKYEKMLRGKEDDPERLNDLEIGAAMERYDAMRSHVKQLKKDKKLVDTWGSGTLHEATRSMYAENGDRNDSRPQNLMARFVDHQENRPRN